MRVDCFGHAFGKADAVDGKRAAGGQGVLIRHLHDQRAGTPEFGMQQPDGIALRIVGAETVGADQFGQPVGDMGRRGLFRPHLVQDHRNATAGQLPGRFRPGETAADHM